MATKEQMAQFYIQANKSTAKTKSGGYIQLETAGYKSWTSEEQRSPRSKETGVEYVDIRKALQGDGRTLYSDNASSCCILAGYVRRMAKAKEKGALDKVIFCRTFLSHVVDAKDTKLVGDTLQKFQQSFNSHIRFYMFTMQAHLDRGRFYGSGDVGFSGAVGGLMNAYCSSSITLELIAKQTIIVTGYQGY